MAPSNRLSPPQQPPSSRPSSSLPPVSSSLLSDRSITVELNGGGGGSSIHHPLSMLPQPSSGAAMGGGGGGGFGPATEDELNHLKHSVILSSERLAEMKARMAEVEAQLKPTLEPIWQLRTLCETYQDYLIEEIDGMLSKHHRTFAQLDPDGARNSKATVNAFMGAFISAHSLAFEVEAKTKTAARDRSGDSKAPASSAVVAPYMDQTLFRTKFRPQNQNNNWLSDYVSPSLKIAAEKYLQVDMLLQTLELPSQHAAMAAAAPSSAPVDNTEEDSLVGRGARRADLTIMGRISAFHDRLERSAKKIIEKNRDDLGVRLIKGIGKILATIPALLLDIATVSPCRSSASYIRKLWSTTGSVMAYEATGMLERTSPGITEDLPSMESELKSSERRNNKRGCCSCLGVFGRKRRNSTSEMYSSVPNDDLLASASHSHDNDNGSHAHSHGGTASTNAALSSSSSRSTASRSQRS